MSEIISFLESIGIFPLLISLITAVFTLIITFVKTSTKSLEKKAKTLDFDPLKYCVLIPALKIRIRFSDLIIKKVDSLSKEEKDLFKEV